MAIAQEKSTLLEEIRRLAKEGRIKQAEISLVWLRIADRIEEINAVLHYKYEGEDGEDERDAQVLILAEKGRWGKMRIEFMNELLGKEGKLDTKKLAEISMRLNELMRRLSKKGCKESTIMLPLHHEKVLECKLSQEAHLELLDFLEKVA